MGDDQGDNRRVSACNVVESLLIEEADDVPDDGTVRGGNEESTLADADLIPPSGVSDAIDDRFALFQQLCVSG